MKGSAAKAIAINVALVVAFSLASFGAGEFVVRLIYKDSVVLMPRYHTDAKYGEFTLRRIRPNSHFWHTTADGSWEFVTNSQGFRNRTDFTYEKPTGVIRVISLGDSHTQGYEVRQDATFSAVVEKYLEKHGQHAEVLNTGVSGFGTAEELAFLENEGIKYDPDAVILAFSGNDFEDNIKAALYRLNADGSLSIQNREHIPGVRLENLIYRVPGVAWLGENSYFYSLLFNNVWDFYKRRLTNDAQATVTDYAIPTEDTASDYETALTLALIKRMYEFCHDRGIQFVILDLPQEFNGGGSSLGPALSRSVPEMSDGFVDGPALVRDYVGVVEVHVPHGARHISEFTHAVLGVAAAKQVESLTQAARAPHS
jgi:lysophospholipase L1-like esterase